MFPSYNMIKKILSKKIILGAIIVIAILGFVIYQFFFKPDNKEYVLEKVLMGTVVKNVSEIGSVKIAEKSLLGFKSAGRIEKISAKVGDSVKIGQELVRIDASQLFIQLSEAQAALQASQASYEKLIAGASPEDVKVSEAAVAAADVSLAGAEQNLRDVSADTSEDLSQTYQSAFNYLDDGYLKIYDSLIVANSISRTYFGSSDQEGIKVSESKASIQNSLDVVRFYIDKARVSSDRNYTDEALARTKSALLIVKDSLEIIRNMTETANYRDVVSAAANIVFSQQAISGAKIAVGTDVNAAQAKVDASRAQLQKARDELALKKAPARQEDIDLYQAKIRQAQAQVSLLKNQSNDSVLRSPSSGKITEINKREGETTQPAEWIISLLPELPFQIKADIYEEDVVDLAIGNPVSITLAAFLDEALAGRVVSINPAEKMVGGVVYYEITVDFEKEKAGIKSGMTADIVIEVAKKENVLVVPREALLKINGKRKVKILEGGEPQEREVEIGLEGDDLIEIISGLENGQPVIAREKL
ncbi:MAG: Efflux transporter, RND family, MFP subunit [Parcubacteria group bacterium GW2011_GWC2_39_11]|nr:MAG: Efflux transporter, RND family, MFP subunit [Parcubacteria group bacterium GW2011_GWC2_39_11]